MYRILYLGVEFFILFIVLPISLTIDFLIWIKVGLVLIGFVYILFILKKAENIRFRIKKNIPWKSFWRRIGITFIVVILATTLYVWYQDPEALFFVPINQPWLYIAILFVYTFLSVWPQEIIYRTFYFERYDRLFTNKKLFLFVNAIVFSLAHLFFRNTLVLVLTFVGGLIFGATYVKFKSTTAVSIEHALYGNWLFTVGMGQMLAFPGMEA
jgi:membrane protease YdiL (CAAX protease family)